MSLDVLTLAVAKNEATSGHDGFSPEIKVHPGDDGETTYRLDITTKDGTTITTPNLIGKQGAKGDDGATGEAGTPGVAGQKGDAGANGKDGKYITEITLKKNTEGKITGGTAKFNDSTTIDITVTESPEA